MSKETEEKQENVSCSSMNHYNKVIIDLSIMMCVFRRNRQNI